MSRSLAVALALTLAACADAPSDAGDRAPLVGGPCSYTGYPVTLLVTAIDSSAADEVRLTFEAEGDLPEGFHDSPFLTGATLRDRTAGALAADAITVGSRLDGTAEVIDEGTCTPVILDVPALGGALG